MRRSIFGRLDGARSLLMQAAIITVSVCAITVWPSLTLSGLWRMTAIALSINLPSALHCEARLDAAR
jgi:hypothetical protein